MKRMVKEAVRRFYRGICQYCGGDGAGHVEHIISRKRGGTDDLKNVTLACAKCNMRKGTLDIDPMFLAIAHARAVRNAQPISLLVLPEGEFTSKIDKRLCRDNYPGGGTAIERRTRRNMGGMSL